MGACNIPIADQCRERIGQRLRRFADRKGKVSVTEFREQLPGALEGLASSKLRSKKVAMNVRLGLAACVLGRRPRRDTMSREALIRTP